MSESLVPPQKPKNLDQTPSSPEGTFTDLGRNFNEFGAINTEVLSNVVDQARLTIGGLRKAILKRRLARAEKIIGHLEASAHIHKEAADVYVPEKGWRKPEKGLEPITFPQKLQNRRAAKRMAKNMRSSDRQFWLQQAWGKSPGVSPLPDDFEKAKEEKKEREKKGEVWYPPVDLLQFRIDNPKGNNKPFRSPEEMQSVLKSGRDVGTPEYKARVKYELRGLANTWRRWGALDAGDRFNKIQKKAGKMHERVVRSAEGRDIPGKFIGRRIKKFEKKVEHLHNALDNLDERQARLQGDVKGRQEQRQKKHKNKKISALDKKADNTVLQAHFYGHAADIMENHLEGHMDPDLEMEPQNKKERRAEKRLIRNYRVINEYRSRTYKGNEAKMHSDIQKYGTDLPLELAGALEGDLAWLRKKQEKGLKRASGLRNKADSLGEST